MTSIGPKFAVLLWVALTLQTVGLVLRNQTGSAAKEQHGKQESAKHKQRSKEEMEADKKMHDCLLGKRIIFIGPSTTKMDYLTLAFFAEYGWWPSQEQVFYGLPPNGQMGVNPLNEAGIPAALPPQVTTTVDKPGCVSGPMSREAEFV